MSNVACIGKCKGCDRMRAIDDGVCQECLGPARGRTWAERAHRCRTDATYAKATYESIQTNSGKKMFVAMFGLPEGAVAPDRHPVPTGTNPPGR